MRGFDRDAQLGALWRDGIALADAAERAGLDAPVRSCPGWSVADLLWHTGEVHYFFRTVVEQRWTDPSAYEEPERLADPALCRWFRDGVQRTVEVLREADPKAAAWSWAPRGGSVAWIVRRMAQETAVHRWDAELAADPSGVHALDVELAVDGIDEFFDHFTDAAVEGAEPVGGTVHLHCTDVEGEWLVSEWDDGGRLEVARAHAKGDAAVRGTSSDLLLLLWRRLPIDDRRFEVFGDSQVVRRLLARTSLD